MTNQHITLDTILWKVNLSVFGFLLLLINNDFNEIPQKTTQYQPGTYSFDSEAVRHNKMAAPLCQCVRPRGTMGK